MTPNSYQQLASRTVKHNPEKLAIGVKKDAADAIHALFGLTSETGELADTIKKHFIYNQPLDTVNLKEECGDLLWYIALLLSACGWTMEDCMKENIEKLKKRYPEKYTDKDALERKDKVMVLD